MSIEDLIAEASIRQALARYCHGVDRGDRGMILSAYHLGAYDDHGGYRGSAEGFADYIITKYDAAPEIGQHHVTNVLIQREGHSAQVQSYFLALNPGRLDTGGGHELIAGRYLDDFEYRDGDWRIAKRVVVLDVTRDALAGQPWPTGLFASGARGAADPSSSFFAQAHASQ